MKYLKSFAPLNENSDDNFDHYKTILARFLKNFYKFEFKADGLFLVNDKGEYATVTLFGNIIMVFDEAEFFKEIIPIITDWFKDVKWDILFPYVDKEEHWEIRFDGKNMRKFNLEMNRLMDSEKFKEYIDAKKFGI